MYLTGLEDMVAARIDIIFIVRDPRQPIGNGPADALEHRAIFGAEQGACWRCGSMVVARDLEQWFFKITQYADELLDELRTAGFDIVCSTIKRRKSDDDQDNLWAMARKPEP